MIFLEAAGTMSDSGRNSISIPTCRRQSERYREVEIPVFFPFGVRVISLQKLECGQNFTCSWLRRNKRG